MLATSSKRSSSSSSKGEDSVSALRTITSLLSTSDVTILPTHIPTIVSLLYSSSVLESCHALANAQQKRKSSEDAGVLLHKYKTRVSALLQNKAAQARWCGAALVKASVESSWECLAGHGSVWVRLLVPLLARPEPPATHTLIIATLARVFTALTENKPTLTREIVVPNLPATIGHLLTATESENELLAVVLEALRDILQSHPVTFRPFAQKTYTLVLTVLSSPNSTCTVEERLAREILALLHLCASGSSSRGINNPDGSSSSGGNNKAAAVADEWTRGFRTIIEDTHLTLNTLLRCVVEDSDYGHSSSSSGKKEITAEAHGTSSLGLSDWKGMVEGVERVNVLLRLLESFFTLPSTVQVSIPIGQLMGLTTRIFSISPSSAQINQAVERVERDFVFARLPELQRGALNLLSTVLTRLGGLFTPFALMLIDQIAYVFAEQGWNSEVKVATYQLLNALLENFGGGLAKNSVHAIHAILSSTCDVLLPPPAPTAAPTTTKNAPPKGGARKQKNSNANGAAGQNFHADAFLSVVPTGERFVHPGLVTAAEKLLATALARLPTAYVRSELRTRMDRTAVLTGNTEAMLASVLFPPLGARKGGAILPHLVGAGSKKGLVIEGVVRPRLPVIWTGKRKTGEEADDEMNAAEEQREEEEEEEEEEDSEEDEERADLFASNKKPYPEEMETTLDESPYKRQKTEAMNSSIRENISTRKPSLLDDMIMAQAAASVQSSVSTETPVPAAISPSALQPSITTASSSLISTTVVSGEKQVETTQKKKATTTATEKPRDFTEGGESDDDMVIPEIVMGSDSSEDEDDEE